MRKKEKYQEESIKSERSVKKRRRRRGAIEDRINNRGTVDQKGET